ncbi:hypothetical protein CAPTEDRAFT_219240 [Capitella teleta]|uniref:Uncharacterized protein n=1 Tax=Capitella teleta TaxID=283909 RepID=R7V2R4_CAPTE|nr:hypothetical protein CAPTEDRAFT_219240 [Capitella teleta]|eukprot:ELU12839.1 hypothetical protein CAPTEDRAFT_219240 [Capitella teleta]
MFSQALPAANVEEACTTDADCVDADALCSTVNEGCTQGVCECADGFAWDGTACNAKVQFGEECIHETQCPGGDIEDQGRIYFQGSCDGGPPGVCGCAGRGSATWQITLDRTACEWAVKKQIGEACASHEDCFYHSQKTASCEANVCACTNNQVWTGDKCEYKGFGETCAIDDECFVEMLCIGGVCACHADDIEVDLPVERCEFSECKLPNATASCINPAALFNLGAGAECAMKMAGTDIFIFGATAKYCNPGLTCNQCPEGGNDVCHRDEIDNSTSDSTSSSSTPFWRTTLGLAVIVTCCCLILMAVTGLLIYACCWATGEARKKNREIAWIHQLRANKLSEEEATREADREARKHDAISARNHNKNSPRRHQVQPTYPVPHVLPQMIPYRQQGYVVVSPPPLYSTVSPPPAATTVFVPTNRQAHFSNRKKKRNPTPQLVKATHSPRPPRRPASPLLPEPQPTWKMATSRDRRSPVLLAQKLSYNLNEKYGPHARTARTCTGSRRGVR